MLSEQDKLLAAMLFNVQSQLHELSKLVIDRIKQPGEDASELRKKWLADSRQRLLKSLSAETTNPVERELYREIRAIAERA